MSNEDLDAAILRLVKDRTEAKRHQAALSAELKAAATVLQSLAQAFTYLNQPRVSTEDPLALLNRHGDLLEPSKLARMIREYADLSKRIEQMDQDARRMGID
ncbi:MAG TPA: hypothetical protein VE959_00135 [Bryobacteraceae bacterium]|nr:hypothetical protein [Bryobacteraceae bacterium]